METPRWNIITPSQYEHERRALDFVRAGLPDHDPYRAWSNFEFQTNDGAIYEVDLLVLTKQGFFLVEIKSWPGRVRGDAGTWTRTTPEGKTISIDNPVLLTNRKSKALVSLLKAQPATKRIRVPWLDAIVFLSADDLHCDLTGPARNRVFLKDRKASESQKERNGILAALLRREGQGIDPYQRSTIDTKVARAIAKAIDESGIRPSQKSRRIGDYVLGDLIADGPGYQDRLAKHVAFDDREVYCRVRQYTVAAASTEETRKKLQRAATREFQIIRTLNHPGILPVLDYKDHELGPALSFRYTDPNAERFDHYLATKCHNLSTDQRLGLLRQVADAVRAAHRKRVVHRALSPQSILVTEAESKTPTLQLYNWQVGFRLVERGLRWSEYSMLFVNRLKTPLCIAFASVATHNHFVLDRGSNVFKDTAPIIKLPIDASEEQHLGLVGLLNSSTRCFWIKQVCHNKGSTVDQHGARQRTNPFEDFYQINTKRIGCFPVVQDQPLGLSRRIDEIARRTTEKTATQLVGQIGNGDEFQSVLRNAQIETGCWQRQMIALQEELDWHCYRLYGLLTENVNYEEEDLPEIAFGQRAFEIAMARRMANGDLETTWFKRHDATPCIEIPDEWPMEYRKLVERRIELIDTNSDIGLVEKPEYKRRWNAVSWQQQEQCALRNWLLDRLECQRYWPNATVAEPRLQTAAQLTDKANHDDEFNRIAAIYRGRSDFDLSALVAELIESEAVPFLPVLRYKAAGLRKRLVWERTWELQRQEDAGEDVGDISVPPKYSAADFQQTDYYRLRGKLDVPKERWISYPHCERDGDPSLVVGWAGWSHLQQATALVAYYDARKREGWSAERLKLILAGVDQLLPWIHQWHPEIDPEYNETAGTSFQTLLESEAQELGLTLEDIRNWTPPKKKKGGRRKRG